MYRMSDPDNSRHTLKCAAGCLIPDELYNHSFEGQIIYEKKYENDIYQIPYNSITTLVCEQGYEECLPLIRNMQIIHDCSFVEYWERGFEIIAHKFGLIYSAPQGK